MVVTVTNDAHPVDHMMLVSKRSHNNACETGELLMLAGDDVVYTSVQLLWHHRMM